jgi:hypothetical protein
LRFAPPRDQPGPLEHFRCCETAGRLISNGSRPRKDTAIDSALRAAIEEHHVVDISTHGRKSGATRCIEIRLWHADGRNRPCKRSWYANLRANPQLTLHVKRGAEGDLEMRARPITDTGQRRKVLSRIASPNELDAWIEGSPLVELTEV